MDESPFHPTTVAVIKKALERWAVDYRTEVTRAMRDLWILEFGSMDPELIGPALIHVSRTKVGFFPNTPDVHAAIEKAQAEGHRLAAAQAWRHVQAFFRFWNGSFAPQCMSHKPPDAIAVSKRLPNGLWYCRPRAFDAATDYALATLGGAQGFTNRNIENEHFHERNFVEAYLRFTTTRGLQVLSRAEAAEIYGKLQSALGAQTTPGASIEEGQK